MKTIEKVLISPITYRKQVENMVCPSCKVRLDAILSNMKSSGIVPVSMTKLEVAYLLGRPKITSELVKKLYEVAF